MTRPRRGRRVSFHADDGAAPIEPADPIAGLRFTIAAQNGGDASSTIPSSSPDALRWRSRRLRSLARRRPFDGAIDRQGLCRHPSTPLL